MISFSLLDLLSILCFVPIVEYLTTRLLLTYPGETTPIPVTIFFPVGYGVIYIAGNLDNPSFIFQITRFFDRLFSVEHLFMNLLYLGAGIVILQLVVGLWLKKTAIGKIIIN